jgi:DNA primase
MISEPDGKCYDRFRERIMFPIRNYRGQVIAFGGRILNSGEPKYLNSPETPIFHKGRELYGLYEARKAVKKLEHLLVVEGYMDVVALAQFGIQFAVATLGTATTPEHLQRLFRTTSEVIFCFDGDKAGRKAGWKALNTALPMMQDGREVRFLFLPDGEDPDSMIRKEGMEAFAERIKQAIPLSSFLFDHLSEQVDMNTPAGQAKLSELAKPLLSQLPEGVFRELMQKKLSQLVGVNLTLEGRSKPPRRKASQPRRGGSQTMTPLRLAITLLIQQPQLALLPELPSSWRKLESTGSILLAELLELIEIQPNLTSVQLVERWRDRDQYTHLSRLAATELPVPAEGMEAEFRGALSRLEEQLIKDDLERLLAKADTEGLDATEKKQLTALLSQEVGQN